MSQPTGTFPWFPSERRLTGATRLVIGFVFGALVALLPMYYLYMGRDAALRGGASQPEAPTSADGPSRRGSEPATNGSKLFAARMTYELSQLPEDLPPPRPKAPAPQIVSASPARPAAAPREDAVATSRVVNARPITAVPPDPRDTTRAMEREARRPEYTEVSPKPQPKALIQATAPRVIEGRDVEVKPSPPAATPTRPIAAAAPPKFVVVTPPSSAAETAPGDIVAGRLAATRDWLSTASPTTHTIQLMGAGSEAQLKNHLRALSKSLEPGRIYVYRTVAQGKPSMTVVYGAYPNRQSALQALEKLPPSITAYKPVLRTVNGIRAEMKQHGTSG